MKQPIRVRRRSVLQGAAISLAMTGLPRLNLETRTAAAASIPPEGAAFLNPDATAEDLTNAWFAMLSLTGAETGVLGTSAEVDARSQELIRPLLHSAFLLQRASGERYVASTYVPSDIDLFRITDVVETRPSENLIVARYAVQTTGASTADSSLVMSDELAPRLSVFHWDDEIAQWKLLSHANFNTPVAAICDQDALVPPMNPSIATSAEDMSLVEQLIEMSGQHVLAGDVRPLFDPQIQAQSASGRGYATIANLMPSKYTEFEPSDVLATRSNDLLVTAYNALQAGELHEETVRSERAPRIVTWRLTADGTWKQIAFAAFATPPELPAGQDCVS